MDSDRLKRPIKPMPDDILELLQREGLPEAYSRRPPYQRNDYLGWIARAKQPQTREKRVAQMVAELRGGVKYMRMVYRGK